MQGYGWSGLWSDNSLGWQLSYYVQEKDFARLNETQESALRGNGEYASSDMYRVKITIQPVLNKKGKYIVRRAKGKP